MDDRIKEHLKRLNKYFLRLSDIRRLEKEIFIQEDLYQASSERYFTGVNPACPAAPRRSPWNYRDRPEDRTEVKSFMAINLVKSNRFLSRE